MQTAIAIYYSSNKGQELQQWVRREGNKLSSAAVGALVKRDTRATRLPRRLLRLRGSIDDRAASWRKVIVADYANITRCRRDRWPMNRPESALAISRSTVLQFSAKNSHPWEKMKSQRGAREEISRNAIPDF
jgi:hypothetical protein